MTRRRMLFAHIKKLVHRTITSANGLVSFKSNIEMPLKVVCEFSPIQEGTGDPSPDNVRPISGWTGCEIAQTGYNLLNLGVVEATPGAYVDNKRILEPYKYYPGFHSTAIAYYSRSYVTDFNVNGQSCSFILSKYAIGITFLVKGGTRIKGTLTGTNVTLGFTSFFDKEWNVVGGAWNIQNIINVPTNAVYAMARVDAPTKDQLSELMGFTIAYETGNVEMQPFDGETIPINWQSEAGTVYGGTVTLNEDGSADLVKTYDVIDLSTVAWQYTAVQHRFYRGGYNDFDFGTVQTGQPQIICNVYAPKVWASFVSGGDYSCGANNGNISIRDERYANDVTAFKAYLASVGAIYVAPLTASASQTYHFDNIGQLQSFLGTNNIWHDMNGSITAEYYNYQ